MHGPFGMHSAKAVQRQAAAPCHSWAPAPRPPPTLRPAVSEIIKPAKTPCAVMQDFADEQGQVARLVHRLASPDPATQFAILQAARKRCDLAALCHVQRPLACA